MLSSWWVHDLWNSGSSGRVRLISWIFWVLLSITLHELAHGWAALWQGDDTPRRLKRMTMNPVVHMGSMSLVVFALVGIAWGMMPIDPSRFRWGRRGRVVVAAAGPAMNLLLALGAGVLLTVWLRVGPSQSNLYGNLAMFLFTGCWLNVVLAAFNLIPIPPLDGSSIAAGLSRRLYHLYQQPQMGMVTLVFLVLVFTVGLLDRLFGFCLVAAWSGVDLAGVLVGNPPLRDVLPV